MGKNVNQINEKQINDKIMIEELRQLGRLIAAERKKLNITANTEHPLDNKVIGSKGLLHQILPSAEMIDYTAAEKLDELWRVLLEKAIKCLRYFDKREAFMEKANPDIVVYGMDELVDYHHRYTDFESLMYGANSRYRDHVFHVVRVWLLGAYALLKQQNDSSGKKMPLFIEEITLDGGVQFPVALNFFEKLSMWTIISLCHDLGYPLEKAEQILGKTRNMMKDFIPNPNIWSDFGYSGVQNSINEYILKFISTKMVPCPAKSEDSGEQKYVGRIQPKYYLKFAKSLESFQHGIISSVIIFKLLVYFLESDFNLNEDYTYSEEDARQFYIRREILRSIAAHTCPDAYNVHITTFSSILFLCDELQEWGRKSWHELYTGHAKTSVSLKLEHFAGDGIEFEETIRITDSQNKSVIEHIIRSFKRQYSVYKSVLRDGPKEVERDFSLKKTMIFILNSGGKEKKIRVEMVLPSAWERNINSLVCQFRIELDDLPDDDREDFNKGLKPLKSLQYGEDVTIRGVKAKGKGKKS